MAERLKTVVKAFLWGALVVLAVYFLVESFLMHNLYLALLAAFTTYVVRQTSKGIPIPRIYREQGITEEMFQGKFRPAEQAAASNGKDED